MNELKAPNVNEVYSSKWALCKIFYFFRTVFFWIMWLMLEKHVWFVQRICLYAYVLRIIQMKSLCYNLQLNLVGLLCVCSWGWIAFYFLLSRSRLILCCCNTNMNIQLWFSWFSQCNDRHYTIPRNIHNYYILTMNSSINSHLHKSCDE